MLPSHSPSLPELSGYSKGCDEGEHALGMPGKGRILEVKSLFTVKGVDW
jgi:hypothetical protein